MTLQHFMSDLLQQNGAKSFQIVRDDASLVSSQSLSSQRCIADAVFFTRFAEKKTNRFAPQDCARNMTPPKLPTREVETVVSPVGPWSRSLLLCLCPPTSSIVSRPTLGFFQLVRLRLSSRYGGTLIKVSSTLYLPTNFVDCLKAIVGVSKAIFELQCCVTLPLNLETMKGGCFHTK